MQTHGKSSVESRRLLIVTAILIFFGTFFSYAHSDPNFLFYYLIVDGCLLGVWLTAAWGLGRWIVLRGESLLVQVTRIAIGLGVMSILILLLGLAGAFGEISALALLALGFVLTLIAIARHQSERRHFAESLRRWLMGRAGVHWLLLLLVPFAGIMAAGGLVMPGILWKDDPAGYDVVEYHLQVPREWYEMGRIAPLGHNVFSYMPFNVEMHYLLAMEVHAGPWAGMFLAQWVHGVFIALTIVGIYAVVRAMGTPLGAVLAAVAAGACPWLAMLGSVAYDEGGLLLYGTLAAGWLVIFLNEPNSPFTFAVLAGACAGLACGCKLTGVPILLVAAPVIALAVRRNNNAIIGMSAYVIAGLLAFSPWLIRNQIWAHNPVFPEAMSILGHGHFSAVQVTRWHQAHSPRADQHSVGAHLTEFWKQVICDWRFAYLLLPVALISAGTSWRAKQTRLLFGILAALIVFWLVFTHLEGRFFVLAIPIMALLLGCMEARLLKWLIAPMVISALVAAVFLHLNFYPSSTSIGLDSPTLLRSIVYPPQVNQAVAAQKPIVLVGDAKAFWFDIPMSRLHYRTVFDVDTSNGRSTIAAWMQGTKDLTDANVIVDPGELDRFSRTYVGIPLPPGIHELREPTVFDLHDPFVQP